MRCLIFFTKQWHYILCALFCLCMGSINTVFAQDRNQKIEITGTISDELGQPLSGASVLEQGTTNGVSPDSDGKFVISVANKNAVLKITYVGYQTQKIKIVGRNNLKIQMQLDAAQLGEVVLIGYGTQKKKLNTGATLQLKGKDLSDRLQTNPLNALQGQSPGVTITKDGGQPGSPTKVFIRGMGTIGNTSPLFIVDGVETESIDYLNSYDIESMDVLKDAASAAIYGSRASNGVVLITTKKGVKGHAQITFDTYYGVQNLAKKPGLLNAQEYAMLMNEKFQNSGDSPFFVGDKMDQIVAMGEGTDWIGVMFKDNVPTQNYSLGFSGGTDQSVFSTSLSYTEQGGILGGASQNDLKRVTFRINSEHKFYGDILKIGENMTVTHISLRGGQQDGRNNYVSQALSMPPILQNTDANGNFVDNSTGLLANFGAGGLANPYALMLLNNQQNTKSLKVLGNFYVELQPVRYLKIRSSVGTAFEDEGFRSYTPKYPPLGQFNNPSTRPFDAASQSDNKTLQLVWTNTLSYNLKLHDHEFDMLLGTEAQKTDGEYLAAGNKNLVFNDYEHAYLDNALGKSNEGLMSMSGYPVQHRLLSYFGRINYNYKEKYLMNVTLRSDGSSNFSKENRRGYFPSVSGGWVLSSEPFMNPYASWLTSFKIRASWGQNGNQNLPPFRYLATVSSNSVYSLGTHEDGFLASGAQIDRLSNPSLKWEVSEQTDIGFDAALLKNKFLVNFDYYKKSTNGWLLSPPISSVIGLLPPWINGGNVINRGVELALTYRETFRNLSFSLNINGAYNKNLVTDVPNGIIHGPGGGLWDNSQEYFRTETGKPMGYYWMLKTNGVFQNTDEVNSYSKNGKLIQPSAVPGDLKYVDQNNDGIINDADRVNVGHPFPNYTYGINMNLNYRGLDLMVNANGVADVQIVQAYYNYARYYPNYTTEALGRWHGEGTSNHYPRLDKANTNWTNNSDIYVYPGDFLRLSNITLSYDIKKLVNLSPISQFRVFISVLNAYTFTKYDGMDPEVGQGQDYETGHDAGFVPNPRTTMVGVNIKL